MASLGFVAALASLAPSIHASAEVSPAAPRVGETYEIVRNSDMSESGSGGFSGSSHDEDTLVERVIGVRPDGIEVEYDLPPGATKEDRASNWQLPARVFKPQRGPLQLLNRSELEARVAGWLSKGKLSRAACGHWIFTWTAFRIDCDPESVLKILDQFDLRVPDLREGAPYQDMKAAAPAPLTRKSTGPEGTSFAVTMQIDPDAAHRDRADSDVVVGEISRRPITFEAALRAHAKEQVSGLITVTLDADPDGYVRRRTRIVKTETRAPGGDVQTRTVTETVERRRMPVGTGHR